MILKYIRYVIPDIPKNRKFSNLNCFMNFWIQFFSAILEVFKAVLRSSGLQCLIDAVY